ncbi:MAG: DUF4835 family protein [Porphyromonas sp.]|nr:DUF4835 family protein [Porphyromonas sp.]
MMRFVFLLFFFLHSFFAFCGWTQELNARVSINVERLGTVDPQLFSDLERQLTDLINLNKWTSTSFSPVERIDCSFSLNLLTMSDNGECTAELYVTAQRPVYNSSYSTPLVTYRDQELNFVYHPGTSIEYNSNTLNDNLVATVVFYVYFVLAADFDSFSELGGDLIKGNMQQLVGLAQQKQDWKGWQPFENDYNRYAISEAYNNTSHTEFRKFWYLYHRRGLDELVGNVRRGYTNILEGLPLLEATWKVHSSSPLLRMFSQIKLDELSKISQEAPSDKKNEAYKILKKIFPTDESKFLDLKR